MTKKEFLKELRKRFTEVGYVKEDQSGFKSQDINIYEADVMDIRGNLRAHEYLTFYVQNEGTTDEKAFTPHPEEEKLERFEERFRKKLESLQLNQPTRKKFLEELGKIFSVVGQVLEHGERWKNQDLKEHEVWVMDKKGNLRADRLIPFCVENEGTSKERVFTPHPEEEKLERFKKRFRNKVTSLQIS